MIVAEEKFWIQSSPYVTQTKNGITKTLFEVYDTKLFKDSNSAFR